MNPNMILDYEQNKKRLEYYESQKRRNAKNKALDKWIEIYSERVTKLERQMSRQGLRTQLDSKQRTAARA
jgi:vacuolar-type H+-ATPase subunit E/Vma4